MKDTIRFDHDMTCSNCGREQDCITTVRKNESPEWKAGDLAVCIYCGNINVLTETQMLRKITPDELDAIRKDHPDTFALLMKTATYAKLYSVPLFNIN